MDPAILATIQNTPAATTRQRIIDISTTGRTGSLGVATGALDQRQAGRFGVHAGSERADDGIGACDCVVDW